MYRSNAHPSRHRRWMVLALALALLGVLCGVLPFGGNAAGAAVDAAAGPNWWNALSVPSRTTIEANPAGAGHWVGVEGAGVRAVLGAPELGATKATGGMVVPYRKGNGYWVVENRGKITAYGDAPRLCEGDMTTCTGHKGDRDIVAVAASPTNDGFWAINQDSFVWAVGDVAHHGQWRGSGSRPTGIVATPSGNGYYTLMADGGISTHGDAVFHGSTGGRLGSGRTAVDMALHRDPAGAVDGYWVAVDDGTVMNYGKAPDLGARPGSFDPSRGRLSAIAAAPDGSTYSVVQNSGTVTTFPGATSAAGSRRTEVCRSGGLVTKCGVDFAVAFNVENRSSSAIRLMPNSHGSASGASFASSHDGMPALPVDTLVEIAAGSSSATWPLSFNRSTAGSPDTRLIMDVTPVGDTSDRQRVELTQPRGAIHRAAEVSGAGWVEYHHALEPLLGPSASVVGSGSLTAHVEETVSSTGTWSGTWKLVISDAGAGAPTAAANPTVTRLTKPYASTDTAKWELLKRPVHRVDIPAVTRRWDGRIPGRVAVEPTAVIAAAPYQGTLLGTLTPTSEPVVDERAGTITFGASSFYHQDPEQTIVPLKSAAGKGFVLEPSGHPDVALDHVGGNSGTLSPYPRMGGAANQTWTVVSRPANRVSFQMGDGCLASRPGSDVGLTVTACNATASDQQWTMVDDGSLRYRITSAADGRVLSYDPSGAGMFRLPAGQPGAVQQWRLTDPTTSLKPATELQLRGGWLGDATVSLVGVPEPSLSLNGAALTNLSLRPTSAEVKPAIVSNGIAAEEATLEISNNSVVVSPNGPLGAIYRHAFFLDGDNNLITGLDRGGSGFLSVSTAPPRHVNSPRPAAAMTAATSAPTNTSVQPNKVYVSTTKESATQIVKPMIAVGEAFDGTANLSLSSRPELARLGPGSLTAGVSLQCSLSGSTYTACEPSEPRTAPVLYRSADGKVRMMVRTTTVISASNPGFTPEHELGMFQGSAWSITGWLVAGDIPAKSSIPTGVIPRIEVPIVTRYGTIASADVAAW